MPEVSRQTVQDNGVAAFRKQTEGVGHAVRANYLYAGVADVYAETGDESSLQAFERPQDCRPNRK